MGKIELMALPYAIDALEPVISKQTLEFHHGKHLAGYVNNLNGLASPPNPGLTPNPSPKGEGSLGELEMLKELVLHSEGAVFNNAGQILNHNLYFGQFTAPKADNGSWLSLRRRMQPTLCRRG